MDAKLKQNLQDRLAIIEAAENNEQLQIIINEKCARDIIYWINHF